MAAIAALGLALAAWLLIPPASEELSKPRPLDTATLVDRFEKVAFRDDSTPEERRDLFRPFLMRWEAPIRLTFDGVGAGVQDYVGRYLGEIERLTGRRVWVIPQGSVTPATITIFRPDLESFSHYYENNKKTIFKNRSINGFACLSSIWNNKEFIQKKIEILFNPLFASMDFRICVLEEIVQSLGLTGDTIKQYDSLFVQNRETRLYFPLNDKILLRTLYDPRLRDGMRREDAMVRVAIIIPELLANYEAEGLEGLYQPLREPGW